MCLQDVRQSKGLTQKQLSDLSGIKLSTLQKYEIGFKNIDTAKLQTLINLSISLDCKIVDILECENLKNNFRSVT